MKKNKILRIVIFLSITTFALGINTSVETKKSDFTNEHISTKIFQEKEFHVLIIDCKSTLYSELCDFVETFFSRTVDPLIITQRKYDNLQDIINSKFKEFDLLIISGSLNFFPDSPEVKDVATLLKIVIEQNKYAFGVCFGLQLLAYLLNPEEGKLIKKGSWDKDVEIDILKDDLIFKSVGRKGDSFTTRQYHNYSVPFPEKENLGPGIILAKSKDGIEIIRIENVIATQFHPESRYASTFAIAIFQNYLKEFVSVKLIIDF